MNEADVIKNIRNKNTDNIFLVFLNGDFSEKYSDLHLLPKGLTFERGNNERYELHLARNSKVEKTLNLLFLQTQSKQDIASSQNRIIVEQGSELALVMEYAAHDATHYSTNCSIEMIAE